MDDIYLSLDQWVEMVNNNQVDYFIFVYCNGSGNKVIYGIELYVYLFVVICFVKLVREFEKQFFGCVG